MYFNWLESIVLKIFSPFNRVISLVTTSIKNYVSAIAEFQRMEKENKELREKVEITLQGAKGVMFWGGKARFMENMTDPPMVAIYANARSVQVSRPAI